MKNKTNSNTNKEEVKINVAKSKQKREYEVTYSIPIEGEKKQLVILLDPSLSSGFYPNISFANMNDKKFNTTDLLICNDLFQADDKVKTKVEDLKSKYKNYVFVDTPKSGKKSEYTQLKEKRRTIDTEKYENVKMLVNQHGPGPYVPYQDILRQLKSTDNLNSLYVSDTGCQGRNNIKELYDDMIQKSVIENGIFLFSMAKNDHKIRPYVKHSINKMPSYTNDLVDQVINKIIGEDTLKKLYTPAYNISMINDFYDDDDKKPLNRMLEKYNINDGVLKNILEQCIEQNIKDDKDLSRQEYRRGNTLDENTLDEVLKTQQHTFLVSIYNYIIQNNKNNKITFEGFMKELKYGIMEKLTHVFERTNNLLVAKAVFDFNLLDKIFDDRVKQINEELPKEIKDIKINKEQLNEILSVCVGNKIEKTLSDTINNYYWFFKGDMYKIPHSCIEKRRNAKEFYQEILNNIKNLEKIAGNEVEVEKAVTKDFNNCKETNYIKWNKLEEKEQNDLLKQIRIAIFKLTLEGKLEEKESKDLLEQVESTEKEMLENRSKLRNETRMKKNEKFIERTDKSILKASQSKANLLHFTRYGGNMFDKKMLKKNYKKQNIPYLKPKSILQQTLYTINKEEKKNLIDK